jgi:cation/acetate symporter
VIALVGTLGVLAAVLAVTVVANRRDPRARPEVQRPQSVVTSAAALGAEHLSAATVVAFTGLVFLGGLHNVWLAGAVGAGYLVLILLVVEPLRRSRVFSLSDFVEWRLEGRSVRRIVSLSVVLVSLVYLLAQYKLVGEVVTTFTSWPGWAGWLVLGGVSLTIALAGATGSSTGFQALLFWIALAGFAVPALVLVAVWWMHGAPQPPDAVQWSTPQAPQRDLLTLYSLGLALVLGVVGFPKFVSRFHTTAHLQAVRATAVLTLALTAPFVVVALVYAVLARGHADDAGSPGQAALILFQAPELVNPGPLGVVLSTVLVTGAMAATLAVTVALCTTIGSYLAQCVLGGGPRTYRTGVVLGSALPMLLILVTPLLSLVDLPALLGMAFHLSAATLAPMVLLGIWWRGLTAAGMAVGMITGLVSTLVFAWAYLADVPVVIGGWRWSDHPALLTVPLAFAVMIGASLLDRRRIPETASSRLAWLHTGHPPHGPLGHR